MSTLKSLYCDEWKLPVTEEVTDKDPNKFKPMWTKSPRGRPKSKRVPSRGELVCGIGKKKNLKKCVKRRRLRVKAKCLLESSKSLPITIRLENLKK